MTTIRLDYKDCWLMMLDWYRVEWRKANPDADPRISPNPDPKEWDQFLEKMDEFVADAQDKKSIIRQFLDDNDGEAPITCPTCGEFLEELYQTNAKYIENNLCPICDCEDDMVQDKCEKCNNICDVYQDYLADEERDRYECDEADARRKEEKYLEEKGDYEAHAWIDANPGCYR